MVGTLYKTAGAALALALGATALAAPAAAQEYGDRGAGDHRGGGDRGGWNGRGEGQRPERPAGGWNGGGWNGAGSTAGSSAGSGEARPAWNRQAPPQVQQQAPKALPQQTAPQPRPDFPRNQGYADPRRDRSYGGGGPTTVESRAAPQPGWDGRRWNGQNWNDRGPEPRRDDGPRSTWQRDRGWDSNRDWNSNRGWDRDRSRDRGDPRRNSWSVGRPGGGWDRDWRRDSQYNWQGWRNSHREVYRLNRYVPPYRSYAYRRLGVGFFLDGGFFGASYWITDPWMYRLPPAYGPYRWIRYYDDALLVDTYSGEVVDVIYDVFW